ncbi:MAG: hypothetical protein U0452_03805 [Anaerolineae bacterium]
MTPTLHLLINDSRLAAVVDMIDELHSAASEGSLDRVTPLTPAELKGWLFDLSYMVNETLAEIDAHQERCDLLQLVARSEAS